MSAASPSSYRTTESIVTATHRVSFQVLPGRPLRAARPVRLRQVNSLLKAVAGYLDPVEGEFAPRAEKPDQGTRDPTA